MARKRKRPEGSPAELEMTPMIDVVFQLLVYFIVPDKNTPPDQKPPTLVRIGVDPDGYTVNDVPASPELLDQALGKVASIDAGQTIMITVSAFSEHGMLVKALDLCAKNGLKSLSVVSASN